ncbi:Olfactory receptor 6J1 [Chelonia mydas]|uniref:Olfactory receptor 6J1 n=1 Tax=Chelonia mydas TaxID=8469 RepID=M7BJY0_CHEMY|nr:Olfactory receptor 6J1 [Chelonia mydas]
MIKLGLPYCGPNIINHFFCDSAPLLHLACVDVRLVEFIDSIISLPVFLGSLLLTVISYTYIICTIGQIPSAKGRQKAFSTYALISLWSPSATAPPSSSTSGPHKPSP